MNPSVLRQLKNALADHIETGGEIAILNGEEIDGVVDQVQIEKELESGMGFMPMAALTFTCELESPSEVPKSGDEITIRDVERRVDKVEQDEISYTLTCINSTR